MKRRSLGRVHLFKYMARKLPHTLNGLQLFAPLREGRCLTCPGLTGENEIGHYLSQGRITGHAASPPL